MNDASRLLDGELTDDELAALLNRVKHDADFRDDIAEQQLISDSLRGLRTLDAGHTLGNWPACGTRRQSDSAPADRYA